MVLKITAPGVPDIYQGTELWDLSLVDPDNRRPVDFAARRALLADLLKRGDAELPDLCAELLRRPGDGRVKLLVTARALKHRRLNRARYDRGDHLPLSADGERARHVVAFARTLDGTASLTLVGRLFSSLAGDGQAPRRGSELGRYARRAAADFAAGRLSRRFDRQRRRARPLARHGWHSSGTSVCQLTGRYS